MKQPLLSLSLTLALVSVSVADEIKPLFYESFDNGKEEGVVGKAV